MERSPHTSHRSRELTHISSTDGASVPTFHFGFEHRHIIVRSSVGNSWEPCPCPADGDGDYCDDDDGVVDDDDDDDDDDVQ